MLSTYEVRFFSCAAYFWRILIAFLDNILSDIYYEAQLENPYSSRDKDARATRRGAMELWIGAAVIYKHEVVECESSIIQLLANEITYHYASLTYINLSTTKSRAVVSRYLWEITIVSYWTQFIAKDYLSFSFYKPRSIRLQELFPSSQFFVELIMRPVKILLACRTIIAPLLK